MTCKCNKDYCGSESYSALAGEAIVIQKLTEEVRELSRRVTKLETQNKTRPGWKHVN